MPATLDLGGHLETVGSAYLERRYSGPGNPMGALMLRRDGMLATRVPFAPDSNLMNGAHGVVSSSQFQEVKDFYGDQYFWIDVTPSTSPELTDQLCREGFHPDVWSSVLYAAPVPAPADADPAVDIEVVQKDRLDVFLDTINTGFGVPPTALSALRTNQSFWCDVGCWHLLLASIDGQAAGAAVLDIREGTAYLAASATLPQYRVRGVHSALLAERLRIATAASCSLVTGQAAPGSVSQCNQERAGLAICHTKCAWTRQPHPT